MPHADPAELVKVADRFDRYARHAVLLVVPVALVAPVDLLTGGNSP